eukprot:TRINITY_DN4512_c0_g1_i1.p9 TRINITY_DN4512_c0_g1~~TRINITY_DN4512_c0_g1_i1.p9  ORF type:complete len:100 (-),score=1.25 TRINITY_DN4512_c0_g1_i1:887-1186(-)
MNFLRVQRPFGLKSIGYKVCENIYKSKLMLDVCFYANIRCSRIVTLQTFWFRVYCEQKQVLTTNAGDLCGEQSKSIALGFLAIIRKFVKWAVKTFITTT